MSTAKPRFLDDPSIEIIRIRLVSGDVWEGRHASYGDGWLSITATRRFVDGHEYPHRGVRVAVNLAHVVSVQEVKS